MWGRRIAYLASVLGCTVLYIYYTQWAVWVLLWWLLVLPVFSLLLSLPAMLTAEFTIHCPDKVTQNQTAAVELKADCRFPIPQSRYKLWVRHCITGQVQKKIETTHCGTLEIQAQRLRVCDYLGLFSKRIRTVQSCFLTVEPSPVALKHLPMQEQGGDQLVSKRGGGFSEEHELREYLPGDDLRQIHWKLSAKTGKTVVRQPMESNTGACVLGVLLRGSPEELDRQLGRLLWLSGLLLARGQKHRVRLCSGRGVEEFPVTDNAEMETMLEQVLQAPQAEADALLPDGEGLLFVVEGQEDG